MKNCSQLLILMILAAVIGFLFYNQSQVNKMKSQLTAISSKFEAGSKANPSKKNIVTPMITARNHVQTAKRLLAEGKREKAQAELDEAIKCLDEADGVSRDIMGELGQYMGKAKDRLTEAYKQAVKDISKQMDTSEKSNASKK